MKQKHKHDKDGVICGHVLRRKRPLRIVAQDQDGVWQFMCGKADHVSPTQAKRICVTCMFEKYAPDLSREQIPPGSIAERSHSRGDWAVRELSEQELSQINDIDEAEA